MTGSRSGTRRSLRSRFDPYLLAPALLGLLLFQPLLARGIPQAPDALLHFYRAALWRWAWDGGALWPRWHTLAFQGYGYPVLSYQAPLLYFLTAALSYVTPGLMVAYKGVMLLACLLYGVGMYLWTRDLLGPRGAVLASAAYVFATFRFRELYFVGGYSQFLAFGLYPLVLYFFKRLAATPSRGYFLGAVLSLAAVLMSHNISAMLFAPMLGVYGLGMAIAYRRSGAWRRLALAGALGLAVSAVFWLPAVGEMRFTRTQVLTQGYWDVREHFLQAGEFLAESPLLDDRAANPSMPFNFGRLHLILAGLGVLTLLRRSRRPLLRFHILFALAAVLIAAFMMLPASYEIWRVVPLIKYVEYPWRLYGVAFLGSSLLAGPHWRGSSAPRACNWLPGPRPWWGSSWRRQSISFRERSCRSAPHHETTWCTKTRSGRWGRRRATSSCRLPCTTHPLSRRWGRISCARRWLGQPLARAQSCLRRDQTRFGCAFRALRPPSSR